MSEETRGYIEQQESGNPAAFEVDQVVTHPPDQHDVVVVSELAPESLLPFAGPATPSLEPETYRVIVERMTRADAAISRKAGLRDKWCVVQIAEYLPSVWYVKESCRVKLIDEAQLHQVSVAIRQFGDAAILCILDTDLVAREPVKKFNFDDVAGAAVVAIVKRAPTSAMARAFIMQKFCCRPPAELTTYEQIKKWVQVNGSLPGKSEPVKSALGNTNENPQVLELRYFYKIEESGTARFNSSREGTVRVPFTVRKLRDIISSCETMSEVFDALCQDADERWTEYDDGAPESNYEYSDHSAGDSETLEAAVDENSIAIKAKISRIIFEMFPDEAERLEL